MKEIKFSSADSPIPVTARRNFKNCIYKLFILEGFKLQKLRYIFCSDKYLLQLNNKYLNHNYYTDVITFFISAKSEPIEGEIYISTDRIKKNAKKYRVPYQTELLRVMLHGALHLCGYNDQNKKAKGQMQKKEDLYIQFYADSREA